MPYSLGLPRRAPCMPGAKSRRSMAHLGLSQRVPLRNSFIPSRRHSLQTGSMCRPMVVWWLPLHAALLGRPAAVVRQRRDVLDGLDVEPGGLQGGDGRLAAGPGALDAHLDLLDAELAGPLGGHLGGALGGERRALTATLEADRAGRSVAQR